jgi:hypothetical protein
MLVFPLTLILRGKKWMRSSRGKAPLGMTPSVSDEILKASKNEASG